MKEGGDEEIRKGIIDEHETGIVYTRGYDAEGRAILCSDSSVPKSGNELQQLRTFVHALEKGLACTARKSHEIGGKPLEKVVVVFIYDGYTTANRAPLKTIKALNDILSNHYPERLSNVYLINPPMIFRVFWNLIRPFLDPVTREKFVFCTGEMGIQQFTSRVKNVDKLEPAVGGTGDVRPFDAQEYLNLPLDVCFDE
jgi:CRAL/TRIO domain